ncbi:MAG: Hpt domain-containing protein, partial [Polyangiaceae bacterium]
YKAHVDVASGDEIGVLSKSFNSMGAAIADREEKLESVTRSLRELFGAMQQIIVAFDIEGHVDGEASRAARKLFGDGEPLVGKDVRHLLYPPGRDHGADAKAFREWLAAAFDLPPDRWEEVAALAPTEVAIPHGDETRILEIEFRPIVQGDQTRRVMLFATDVTEERRLKKAVRDQQAEHERRMTAMRRLLAGGGQVFIAFLDGSKERAQRAAQLAEEGAKFGQLTSAQIDELFRHAHTIKGEARAFDLPELEQAAQSVEADLVRLRNDARSGAVPGTEAQKLTLLLDRVKSEIERAGDVFVAASPVGRAALDRITVQRQDITDLLEWVRTSERAMPAMRKGGPLAKLVSIADRIGSRPFGESTLLLVEAAPTWAEREGKKVRIEVDGREVRVPAKLASALAPALVHLVRNAIAHGIETPAVRADRKKPDIGIVKLVASEGEDDSGPTIRVEDDGGGLDRKKILERAEELEGEAAASVA